MARRSSSTWGPGRRLDATLIAVLAYAGLRPGEAIGLRWHDIGERTILVERSVAFGQLKSTKSSTRSVRLLGPLRDDLNTWREQASRTAETDLIFPSPDGSPWNADRARNWRKRTFAEAATRAGVPAARPYDLRHGYVSLLIAQGAPVVEVARQAGHAPTMTLGTYAHLFDELDGADHHPAEGTDPNRATRNRVPGSVRFVSASGTRPDPGDRKTPDYRGFFRAAARIRTGDPFITRESAGDLARSRIATNAHEVPANQAKPGCTSMMLPDRAKSIWWTLSGRRPPFGAPRPVRPHELPRDLAGAVVPDLPSGARYALP
jgi:hypothetical protein